MSTECITSSNAGFLPVRHESEKRQSQSFLARFLTKIADYFERHKQYRTDRAAFQQMLALDDDTLQDIGITRDDVIWASKLPINVNASQALEEARKHGHA